MRYVNLRVEKLDDMRWLIVKDHLLLLICLQIGIRSNRNKERNISWYEQSAFGLSEMEYLKFWLKETQKGQITRRIKKLIWMGIVEKVDWKIGSKWGTVYRLTNKAFILPYFQDREQNREKTVNKQRSNRDEVYSNSNTNKNISKKFTSKQLQSMTEEELIDNYRDNHDLYIKALGKEKTKEIKEMAVKKKAK